MSKLKKIVILLALIAITIPTVVTADVYLKLKSMQKDGDFSFLSNSNQKNDDSIINILLLGSDARPGEEVSRTDSMMILTIDNKHNDLKLTSLGRDTYVNVPGHGFTKLTHAYAYGKEKLLIKTIEENFELDIQNYVLVNFFTFMDIIQVLDGVDVTVDQSEIHELNKFINETYRWDDNPNKGPIEYITSPGEKHLNEYQALSFVRIRKNDSTMKRDNRQRMVLESVAKKIKNLPFNKYSSLLDSVLPYVETNMSPTQMLSLAKDVLSIDNYNIDTMQFPLHPENEIRLQYAGYVIPFEKYELPFLHDFIFKDKKPTKEKVDLATQQYLNSGDTTQYIEDSDYMNGDTSENY